MATFLDIGILSEFNIVFVFLLVFSVIFAFLESIGIFGKDKKGIHAIMAFALSFLIIISKVAVSMVNFMTPWFMILFLFIFFAILSVRMFGASEADTLALIKDTRVYPYLIIVMVIILVAGFSNMYGQSLLEQGTGVEGSENGEGDVILPGDIKGGSTKTDTFGTNVLNTLVHPKVLGMIAIMFIGLFTITFLTKM